MADALGISPSTLSTKERGVSWFSVIEMRKAVEFLKNQGVRDAELRGLIDADSNDTPAGATAAGPATQAAATNLAEGIFRVEVGPDGRRRYRVTGDSMAPAIAPGSIISTEVYNPERDPSPVGKIVQVYVWDAENERGGPVLGILHEHADTIILTKANALNHPPVVVPREHVQRIERVVNIAPPGQ